MQCAFSIKQRLAEPENLILTSDLLRDTPGLTRAQLTRELCHRLDLRDPKGDWQIGTTAKALRDLETQGLCPLPEPMAKGPRSWNPTRLHRRIPAAREVPATVEEVQGLCLVEVQNREQLQIWNELMLREHPLRDCRLVGRQLRYLVGSDHGWLGAIGFWERRALPRRSRSVDRVDASSADGASAAGAQYEPLSHPPPSAVRESGLEGSGPVRSTSGP